MEQAPGGGHVKLGLMIRVLGISDDGQGNVAERPGNDER
jgi:hypothetical protein